MAVQISNIINYYFPFGRSATRELVCATTCVANVATNTTAAAVVAVVVDVAVMSNEPEFMTCSLVRTNNKHCKQKQIENFLDNVNGIYATRSSIMWRTIDFNGVNSGENTT